MSKSLQRKIEAFEQAVREHAFIGTKSEYPDEVQEIEDNYHKCKQQLINAVYALTHQLQPTDSR